MGVFDGTSVPLREDLVGGDMEVGRDRWKVLEADLDPWAGKEILLTLELPGGGRHDFHKEAYLDEISVVGR